MSFWASHSYDANNQTFWKQFLWQPHSVICNIQTKWNWSSPHSYSCHIFKLKLSHSPLRQSEACLFFTAHSIYSVTRARPQMQVMGKKLVEKSFFSLAMLLCTHYALYSLHLYHLNFINLIFSTCYFQHLLCVVCVIFLKQTVVAGCCPADRTLNSDMCNASLPLLSPCLQNRRYYKLYWNV